MEDSHDITQFMEKIKKMEKGEHLDLSSGEDLSVAVMNLISIEEHLFFSGGKTKYYDLLQEVREMRKQLMKKLVKDYEGEMWCISKHLLAASMRLMEVGTKSQTKGDKAEAEELFKKALNLYNLFWGINLGMVKPTDVPKQINEEKKEGIPIDYKPKDFLGKISSVVGKILDCCRE